MEVGNKEINFLDLNIRLTKEKKRKFDIYRKRTYTDVIIPNDSYHPIQYKMAAINNFCHRINSCIEDEENRKKEIERIKIIVKNNKYNTNVVDKVFNNIKRREETNILFSEHTGNSDTKKIQHIKTNHRRGRMKRRQIKPKGKLTRCV